MMGMKPFIFRQSEKKQISGDLGTEYARDRKKAAEIPMGDNGFCSLSDVQNIANLVFFALFEKPTFDAHHTPKWANSDRNSLMWSILKSEHSFEIFEIFEKSIIPMPDMLRIRPHMKSSKKIKKFAFPPKNSISSP